MFTIFSNGSIIPPGFKFTELHTLTLAARSYALLLHVLISTKSSRVITQVHVPNIEQNMFYVLYSRKYWRSLNLAVWPQTERKKYWRNLNLAVAPCSVLRHHYKHCERVEKQGALPSSRLRYLNKAVS